MANASKIQPLSSIALYQNQSVHSLFNHIDVRRLSVYDSVIGAVLKREVRDTLRRVVLCIRIGIQVDLRSVLSNFDAVLSRTAI